MIKRNSLAILPVICALAVSVTLAGCGNKNSAPANTGTVAPLSSPMTETQKETRALPLAEMAPVPKSLHCSGAVVWANTKRKSFHLAGDPYYGRTRHGEYMCQEAAVSQGYHPAGSIHKLGTPKPNSMIQRPPTTAPSSGY